MSAETWISIVTAVVTVVVAAVGTAAQAALLIATIVQLRRLNRQLMVQNQWEIVRANREILGIGMAYPECLAAFGRGGTAEQERLSLYAQMWINQMHTTWYSNRLGLVEEIAWEALRRDIQWSFADPAIVARWTLYGPAYPVEFQAFVRDAQQRTLPTYPAAPVSPPPLSPRSKADISSQA